MTEGAELVEANRGGGRRWSPVYFLEPISREGAFDMLPDTPGMHLDRSLEYRLVWQADKGLWRLDCRRFVAGG